jgi:hypothetical protein
MVEKSLRTNLDLFLFFSYAFVKIFPKVKISND